MYKTIKTMTQALTEARAYRDPVVEDKGFSSHPDVENALKKANEEVKEALDFDYAIVDRDNKIIKLYNAGDKIHYGNILDAKKNLEKEVPKNKTPLKLVTLAPGRSRNYKVGGTVLGIGEEVVTEDIYGKQDSKLMGTVTMVHNTSGKEVVVSNDPNAVKNQEKLGFKVQKEETYQLSERDLLKLINKTGFSKADFKTNENDNDHSLNAIMLARAFGTSQEFKDMINIDKRHKERGSITEPDYQQRDALVKKYYPRLK